MKILIINENHHSCIGGIEIYSKKLFDLFLSLGHNVFEYSFNINPEKIGESENNKNIVNLNDKGKKSNRKLTIKEKRVTIKKAVLEIAKIQNEYDLIINQTANVKWPKEIYKNSKWLYVQHFNPSFYKQKFILGRFLAPVIYWGMHIFGIKNPFNYFQNFIFFSKQDAVILNKKKKNHWIISLAATTNEKIIEIKKRKKNSFNKKLIYFGRIDTKQKQIKKMIKFSEQLNLSIDFYGSGNTKVFKDNESLYKGMLKNDDILDELQNYHFFILLSNYEGFPLSVVESLSAGVPIIINNFCPSSKFLVNGNGFLLKNKKDIKKLKNLLDDDELYSKIQNNCFQFALEHLTIEKWQEKWKVVLNYFEEKK